MVSSCTCDNQVSLTSKSFPVLGQSASSISTLSSPFTDLDGDPPNTCGASLLNFVRHELMLHSNLLPHVLGPVSALSTPCRLVVASEISH